MLLALRSEVGLPRFYFCRSLNTLSSYLCRQYIGVGLYACVIFHGVQLFRANRFSPLPRDGQEGRRFECGCQTNGASFLVTVSLSPPFAFQRRVKHVSACSDFPEPRRFRELVDTLRLPASCETSLSPLRFFLNHLTASVNLSTPPRIA